MTEATQQSRIIVVRSLLQQPGLYLDSLPDEEVFGASLPRERLSVAHHGELEYPATRLEFDALRQEHGSFIALDVDEISTLVRGLRRTLQETFNRHVRMSEYMSGKGRGALTSHFDTHPSWWFQLGGDKELRDHDTEQGPWVLSPGDGAFIPAGVRHSTTAISDSRHLCARLRGELPKPEQPR